VLGCVRMDTIDPLTCGLLFLMTLRRRRRKTVEIINLEDGFPEPTEAPPVPEWVAKHKAEMIRKAQTQKANSLTLVDSMGRRRVVPANNKAKDRALRWALLLRLLLRLLHMLVEVLRCMVRNVADVGPIYSLVHSHQAPAQEKCLCAG